jgi:glutaredoxin
MNKNVIIIVVVVSVLLIGGFTVLASRANTPAYTGLDDFAKCLTEKGVTMYGAAWCPHCQKEKKNFGSSFQYVKYVECPNSPQVCTAAGVENYPTWILGDGTKLEGEQGVKKLSEVTSCALPAGR